MLAFPISFHHVTQLADLVQHPAELQYIGNFQGQSHVGNRSLAVRQRIGAQYVDLLIRQNAAMITAAGASQRDPQQWAEPTEQEHNALFDGMLRHGASERLLGILADNAELARASDKDKCDIGVSINATVNDMPPELAARFVAMWHRPL